MLQEGYLEIDEISGRSSYQFSLWKDLDTADTFGRLDGPESGL